MRVLSMEMIWTGQYPINIIGQIIENNRNEKKREKRERKERDRVQAQKYDSFEPLRLSLIRLVRG